MTVRLQSMLREVVPPFLERRRGDVRTLADAVGCGDYATIRNTGHRMHGNGASMGFPEISEIGAALEHAAAVVDAAAIESLTARLESYLDSIDVVYE